MSEHSTTQEAECEGVGVGPKESSTKKGENVYGKMPRGEVAVSGGSWKQTFQ